MDRGKEKYVIPVLVTVLGIAWSLNAFEVFPALDWIWTIGMAAIGILTLFVGGIKKEPIVVGFALISAAIASIFRQTGRINLKIEAPILVLIIGVLLLLVEIMNIPSNTTKNNNKG